MADYSDFTVIIPTLNEGENLPELLESIYSSYAGVSVIIADDGSMDDTSKTAGKFARLKGPKFLFLDRSNNPVKGLSASIIEGIALCKTEFFIVMDGDLQHPVSTIGQLASALKSQDCDVVVASRASVKDWQAQRQLLSLGAATLGKISLAMRGKQSKCDILSGFFAMKTQAFASVSNLRINPHGYKILFDIIKQLPNGAKICSVPYDFGLRAKGQSKIGPKHIAAFLVSLAT